MQFPVHIELHRSFLRFVLLFLIHLLAAGSVMVLPWSSGIRWLLLLFIGVSAGRSLFRSEIADLCLVGQGRIDCLDSEGRHVEMILHADTTVFRHLIVLRFKTEGAEGFKYVTLFPDQMTSNEFRALRLWLRWKAVSQIDSEIS